MIATVTPARAYPANFLRRFTATLVAGATALSLLAGSAVPARADAEDVAKILAGLAAIAIIGKTLNDNDKPKANPVHSPWPRQGRPGYDRPGHDRPGYGRPGHDRPRHDWPGYGRPGHDNGDRPGHGHNRPPRDEVRAPRLPGVCAFTFDSRRNSTVYSERCLEREGFNARLPRYCAQEVHVRGRRDRVYDQRCLIEAGFRPGNRRY